MRSYTLSTALLPLIIAITSAYPQHQQQIDPAYLQQYYQQVAQAAGAARSPGATPIYEQDNAANQQPQYISQGQQLRVKDTVQEQVRQQQQPQKYVAPTVRQYLQQPQQQQPQQVQYISQPQPQQYSPQPAKQTLAVPRRIQSQPQYQSVHQGGQKLTKAEIEDEEEVYDTPANYQFGFDVRDDEFTNYQNRKESRDGNVIKGSYSVVDSDGFIRTVTYTADPKEGFKAEVVREPTDIVIKFPTSTQPPPQHSLRASAPQQHQPQQHYRQQEQPQQQQQYVPQQYSKPSQGQKQLQYHQYE